LGVWIQNNLSFLACPLELYVAGIAQSRTQSGAAAAQKMNALLHEGINASFFLCKKGVLPNVLRQLSHLFAVL